MITVDFYFETKIGTELTGHLECVDFDDAMDIASKFAEWCDCSGYRLRRCDINDIKKEDIDEV